MYSVMTTAVTNWIAGFSTAAMLAILGVSTTVLLILQLTLVLVAIGIAVHGFVVRKRERREVRR